MPSSSQPPLSYGGIYARDLSKMAGARRRGDSAPASRHQEAVVSAGQ
jgi:hypothetical protein